jgi:hypothetical protein
MKGGEKMVSKDFLKFAKIFKGEKKSLMYKIFAKSSAKFVDISLKFEFLARIRT